MLSSRRKIQFPISALSIVKLQTLFDQAKSVAENGQFSEAGSLILKALDQERRAQISGPQVLQLIKPEFELVFISG